MKAVIWSKDFCPYCERAKGIMMMKGIEFEERNLSHGGWTKTHLLESVPNARTVPQIFIDGEYIGGCTELEKRFLP